MPRRTNARTHAPSQLERELAAVEAGNSCPIRLLRDVGYGGRHGDYTNIIDYKASKNLIEGVYAQKMGYYSGMSDKEMELAMSALADRAERMGYRLSDPLGRDNATFTLDQTYGSGHGDRSLIQAFYYFLDEFFPGDTPIPIPPESHVHPKHDAKKQAFIFADFLVRKIAPITLRVAGLKVQGAKLERLKQITDEKTARAAGSAAGRIQDNVRVQPEWVLAAADDVVHDLFDDSARPVVLTAERAAYDAAAAAFAAAHVAVQPEGVLAPADYARATANTIALKVADAAYYAAKVNPDATWAAVNEMLQAL